MELPIDHFRLLGVSPSASAEEVLRFFQLRLDRIPHPGFTPEVMTQRSELLRLSAELLCDKAMREEYESALLNGALGLELSFNREVAGLILLWEGGGPFEAFKLARKALQPPQAPALGSGREADLALVAALACRDAALQEQEQRHYASAAEVLQEGIQLLQRMGKLLEQRKILERDLEALLPYRILDLLSRDLSEKQSRQEGLNLLDGFVLKRGGLEGRNLSSDSFANLTQDEFEVFFQQIRKFLTAQEQIDLFLDWQKRGSQDAGFLAALALVASGFFWRKPEVLLKAKKNLNAFSHQAFDAMPLLGCIDLLLADVEQAKSRFRSSQDIGLKNWLTNYPGEELAALCHYCRNWLQRDVLPGFRDIEIELVDLEAWFADRDVQAYVEKIERRSALGIARAGFSFLSGLSSDKSQDDNFENASVRPESTVSKGIPNTERSLQDDEDFFEDEDLDPFYKQELFQKIIRLTSFFKLSNIKLPRVKFKVKGRYLNLTFAVIILIISGTYIGRLSIKNSIQKDSSITNVEKTESSKNANQDKILDKDVDNSEKPIVDFVLLTKEAPSQLDIKNLIEAWLKGKAEILSGKENANLSKVARPLLVKIVQEQRQKDIEKGESQIIYAFLKDIEIESQTSKRISVNAVLSYRDQRLDLTGKIISETIIPSLKLNYVLGRQKKVWQLVDFSSRT